MIIDTDKLIERALQDAIREGITAKLSGYNSPLDDMIKRGIEKHVGGFRDLIDRCFGECLKSDDFQVTIKDAVTRHLAKTLIQKFGGEIERQVNDLKSNPGTRARITLAIDEIVKSAK